MNHEFYIGLTLAIAAAVALAGYIIGNNKAEARYDRGFIDGYCHQGRKDRESRDELGRFKKENGL